MYNLHVFETFLFLFTKLSKLLGLHTFDQVVYDSIFSLLPEAGIILLLEFYDLNWVNFDHFICQN